MERVHLNNADSLSLNGYVCRQVIKTTQPVHHFLSQSLTVTVLEAFNRKITATVPVTL